MGLKNTDICLVSNIMNFLSMYSSLINLNIRSKFLVYFLASTFRLQNLNYKISISNIILLTQLIAHSAYLFQLLYLVLRLLVLIMLLHYKGLLIKGNYNLDITERLYLELYNKTYNINISAMHSIKIIFVRFLLTLYRAFAGNLEYLVLKFCPRVKEALNTL